MEPLKISVNCDNLICYYKKLLIPKTVLCLVRHAESECHEGRKYAGWYDSVLTRNGKVHARISGEGLKRIKFKFDVAFTSVLTRAIDTLKIILQEIDQNDIPVVKSWMLNPRQLGAITGLSYTEAEKIYGKTLTYLWRDNFDMPPPELEEDHELFKLIVKDPRYLREPYPSEFPLSESLKDCMERTVKYWKEKIFPTIKTGKNVLIITHENNIRGILKHILDISDGDILNLRVPHGLPYYFELNFKGDVLIGNYLY